MNGVGAAIERSAALKDVLCQSYEYGMPLTIRPRTETTVARDAYGSIVRKDTVSNFIVVNALPVEFQPNEKQLQKAGIMETADCLIYTPMLFWTKNGYTFRTIDFIRSTCILQGEEYVIKSKGLANQFFDTFLYITFGLAKE